MRFIFYLIMVYYDEDIFTERTKLCKEEKGSWRDKALSMAGQQRKTIKKYKNFLSKNIQRRPFKKAKSVLLNAIKLYDGKSKIIKLFEDKNIEPSN